MARPEHKEDFTVDVEGLGQFTFGRRKQVDQYKIRALYGRLTNNNWKEDGTVGDMEAWMHSNLEVLTVKFPTTFSLDKLDPLTDPEDDDRMSRVYVALRQKELSFRPQPAASGAGESSGAGT